MARVSTNEREFILAALRQDLRIDGRGPFESRRTVINFQREDGAVEVRQGDTRVHAVVTAQLKAPYPDRPNEGSFAVFTEFSPMADPSFEPGRPGELAIELGRVIDRGLRDSRAVDTESLCVVAGKTVWALRIDIHILDNGGNLIDVANVAALAGLLSFRRPECTLGGADGQEVIVHPPEVREPLPLTLHHLPIAFTFGYFTDGELAVLDPSLKEEAVMKGRFTITLNPHGELCAVQKGGGVGIRPSEVMRCVRIASSKVVEMAAFLKKGVEEHEIERAQRKIKRLQTSSKTPEAVQVAETPATVQEVEPIKDVEMESSSTDTDEALEPQEQATLFFEGGNSSWGLSSAKPIDDDAMKEFDMIAEDSKSLVSAAAVYQQQPELKQPKSQQLGPIFASHGNIDVEMAEASKQENVPKQTSLLDAVKKRSKKRKKGQQSQ